MKYVIVLFLVFLMDPIFGQEEKPVWPQIGSAFPKSEQLSPKAITRLGNAYWQNPPKLIGPFAPDWFEYSATMWGADSRIANKAEYYEFIKSLYFTAGLVYSAHKAEDINSVRLPYYNTNVTNVFYLRNKGGDDLRKGFKSTRGKEFLERKTNKGSASLEDPSVDGESIRIAKNISKYLVSSKPMAYDLRDEGTYTISSASPFDFDFSPVSLKNFRVWLKAKYESLDSLNLKWKTSFKTWDEVMPLTTDEIFKRELTNAPDKKDHITQLAGFNIAPWADHREYNDDTFQSAIARVANAIYEADNNAPVGYSGTQMPSAYGGFDFWKISKNISWIEYYDCNGSREILRCFMPYEYPKIQAVGMGKDISAQFPRVWGGILHGDNGVLVWPYHGNNTQNTIALDVEDNKILASKKGEEIAKNFREVRNGVSVALRHSTFETNQIAVYYSQASLRAAWMLEVKKDGASWINRASSWEGSHNYYAAIREGFFKLIEDMGYQYTSISSAQVENNEMKKLGVKVIIMPRILALSKKEIENLKEFVKEGGVIISDVMAGRLDEHCVDYGDALAINELLGVKREKFAYQEETKEEEDKASYVGGFGYPISFTFTNDFGEIKKGAQGKLLGFYEPGLALQNAKAYASASHGPVLLENSFGKGFAYTLNFDIPNYLKNRNSLDAAVQSDSAFQRNIFKVLFEKSKVFPPVKVSNSKGIYPAGVETISYTQDKTKYLALQVNQSNMIDWETLDDIAEKNQSIVELKLKIELPEASFVTEMMSGKSLGKQTSIEVNLKKDRPLVFSLLPYQITGISVKSTLVVENNVLPVEFALESKDPVGDHVLNVELFDSTSKPIPHFLINVPLSKGKYSGGLDFSHVKLKGDFELVFKDVLTGLSLKKSIKIP